MDEKRYELSSGMKGFLGVFFFVFLLFPTLIFLVIFFKGNSDLSIVWVPIVFMSVGIWGLTVFVFSGRPTLVLNSRSLISRPIGFGKQETHTYSWDDVGHFKLVSRNNGEDGRSLYAMAYSDITHDILASKDQYVPLSRNTADIVIPLSYFGQANKNGGAQKIVDELNHYRSLYGKPRDAARHATATQIEEAMGKADLVDKKSPLRWIQYAVLAIFVINAAVQFYQRYEDRQARDKAVWAPEE